MKKITIILTLFICSTIIYGQKKPDSKETENNIQQINPITKTTMAQDKSSKDNTEYQSDDIKGKRTAYTEIIIDASPEKVREKLLEFDKWSEWCKVIPQIDVIKGDINHLETKPTLELWVNMGRDKDPQKAPSKFTVKRNDEEVFVWGVYQGFLLKIEHVFVFTPTNNGKGTHLIHYEVMSGLLGYIFMTKKLKGEITKHYNIMNKDLKELCEK